MKSSEPPLSRLCGRARSRDIPCDAAHILRAASRFPSFFFTFLSRSFVHSALQITAQRCGVSTMEEHSIRLSRPSFSDFPQNLFQRLQKIRGLSSLLVLVSLLVLGQPDPNQRHLSGSQQVEERQAQKPQHGPQQISALALPQIPSKTHREQAKEFSRKLVAGFWPSTRCGRWNFQTGS